MDPFTFAVSVAALVVSIVSAVVASRIAGRQNALQERMLALETARERDRVMERRSAQLAASIVQWGHDYRLRVHNGGNVTARNIRVLLDGRPMREHALALGGEDEIIVLGPGASAEYILTVATQSQSVLTVRIEWADDSGEDRSWESQLKL